MEESKIICPAIKKAKKMEEFRKTRKDFLEYLHSPRVVEMRKWRETQREAYREMGMTTEEIEEAISIY